MKVSINKSVIKGRVKAPSSKSYTIRGLMCAALAEGESELVRPLGSDDTEAALSVLSKIGVRTCLDNAIWRVSGGTFHEPESDLFCGDSAATLRFMTAICSVVPGRCRLTAGPSLAKRPVKTLVEALRQLGVDASCNGELAPMVVTGGRLRGGETELRGDISSQYVSALLLVAPFAEKDVKIKLTTPLESKPYVLMTLECMEKFGVGVKASSDLKDYEVARQSYQPAKYTVEGDWSSVSYLLALGAVSGEISVENLNPGSLQGDKIILDFLREMGTSVKVADNSVTVRKSKLNALKADLTDCIDLLPTMAVLAALARGTSEFSGIQRARLKESNRVSALREALGRAGIMVIEEENKLTINGGETRHCVIDSLNDHRIAMAFSILGAGMGGVVINGAECVSKTYPDYWNVFESIGGEVKYEQ
ncbi:MAG: 3-phosphoshikimate 1-carboxyvinyltransferase [Dehalococcoidia bacterium]|nr:3-phosphoshikimate 1-carboxyvinyltransferase [Dehalococcoidia bacterium]